MRTLADNSIDALVTNPPYGFAFMNKHWEVNSTRDQMAFLLGAVRVLLPKLLKIKGFAKTNNFHATVKPLKLMTYLIQLITPPKGIVLDPFMGSGSTGVAAKQLGFEFIGIEKEKEYLEIAEKRINSVDVV